MRLARHSAFVLTIILVMPSLGSAQWLRYPTADVPRTADGKPNLAAPTPRLPDGKPDLSGLWHTSRKNPCNPASFIECGLEIGGSPLALDLGADEALDPSGGEVVKALQDLTYGEGVDAAFETSGHAAGQNGAVDGLRLGGRAVFVGFGSREKTLNPAQFIGRQLTLMGSFVLPIHLYWDMVKFILDRQVALENLITHRFTLEQAPAAFTLFDSGKTGKVILEWS